MKRFILFVLLLSLFSCSDKKESEFSLINHIPDDSEIIILTPNIKALIESSKTNSFLTETEFTLYNNVSDKLKFLKHLNFDSETGINLSNTASENLIYTISTKKNSNLIVFDSIKDKSVESFAESAVNPTISVNTIAASFL